MSRRSPNPNQVTRIKERQNKNIFQQQKTRKFGRIKSKLKREVKRMSAGCLKRSKQLTISKSKTVKRMWTTSNTRLIKTIFCHHFQLIPVKWQPQGRQLMALCKLSSFWSLTLISSKEHNSWWMITEFLTQTLKKAKGLTFWTNLTKVMTSLKWSTKVLERVSCRKLLMKLKIMPNKRRYLSWPIWKGSLSISSAPPLTSSKIP